MMTDKEIIALYSSGRHEQAFNQIVENYTERIYWHVRRFVCSHEDSNDLLQDIFIKIWAALPSFRGDAQLFTWIYRIARNEVLNHLRKEKYKALISFDSESKEINALNFSLRRWLWTSFVAILYIHVKSCASPLNEGSAAHIFMNMS